MAAKYEIATVFTDYREMIAKGDLDALVVAAPDDLRYPMTMAALDAGLHVMCEKAMALNAGQAREMLEKAESAGVVHMVHFTWRWAPYTQYLRTLIGEGYIGRCFYCYIDTHSSGGRGTQYRWRRDASRSIGILGDLGSHWIDLARWYVGDIARVSAHLGVYGDRLGPDGQPYDRSNDSATLLLEFENGAQGTIQAVGWCTRRIEAQSSGLSCVARQELSKQTLCSQARRQAWLSKARARETTGSRRFPCRTTPGTTPSAASFSRH